MNNNNINIKYFIYINGFWPGFGDKSDANNIGFFEELLKKTKISKFIITDNINEANVLFESLFAQSLVNFKNWTYKIHYSGESRTNNKNNYDVVLFSEQDNNNVIDLPLFVYYIYNNNFLDYLINPKESIIIPKRFCCFIVSNPNCQIRNNMFDKLNSYKKVDSYGRFKNNMNINLSLNYWTPEFRNFISKYKFIICFENSKMGTYSTEKIINPLLSNIVPIYWSSAHIKNIFNTESILFLENESEDAYNILINKIIELDNNDDLYLKYVNNKKLNMDYWNNHYDVDILAKKINDKLI
jgi:hypothetical protein